MMFVSTVLMFGLTYLNTYAVDHVFFSETRLYMALMMGAVMAAVMLTFMRGMYKNARVNAGIYAACAVVFGGCLIEAQRREIAEMKALIADLEAAR